MKKILFLLLLTVSSYGQTLQNPTFGNTTTNTLTVKTNIESTTATKINAQETDGKINWLQPINIPIPTIPLNYTVLTPTLGSHLSGIDNKLGTIVATTAGVTTRVWFTADPTTITAGTFYLTNALNKGAAASAIQNVVNNDNEKKYFTQDLIGNAFATATIFPPGVYAGNLSASTTPNSAQQRWTVELYRCNNAGTPIASGVAGAPVGSLGVTVIIILDSGLLTLADGSVTNVPVSGSLGGTGFSIATGERIRYHVSAEKVGTTAANITQSVYYGTSYNSYLDVPVTFNTSGITNVSTVAGATATDAFNTLNTAKANLSGAVFSGAVEVSTPTLANHAVTKAYADGLVVGLLDDRGTYNASSNLFPTTGGSGSAGTVVKGDIWYVGTAGTLGGKSVAIGDSFRALVDSPGQTASNWSLLSSNLSYVPANDANVVHLTGNETKSGTLFFNNSAATSSKISINNTDGNGSYSLYGVNTGVGGLAALENQGAAGSYNYYGISKSSGDNFIADSNGFTTGFNYVGKNTGVNTFTVNKLGTTTATSFIKSGVTATNILLAGGTDIPQSTFQTALTNPVTGTGTNGVISRWSGTGTQTNSSLTEGTAIVSTKSFDISGTGDVLTLRKPSNNFPGISFIGTTSNTVFEGGDDFTLYTNSVLRLKVTKSGIYTFSELSGTGTRTVVADASGNLSATTVQPLKYVALLSQSGTSAPTAIVLENTLGGTVVWSRSSAGQYIGTLSGAFTSNKTACIISTTNNTQITSLTQSTSNTVVLNTSASSTNILNDGALSNTLAEIRVYP